MMAEQWLPIPDAPYEVSDQGRVRRSAPGKSTAPGRVLSDKARKRDGYTPVVLSLGAKGVNRQALVHHLVAEVFLGPKPSDQHEVAHKDGNPANNAASNLRWATHAENMGDMVLHGRSTAGERHAASILTEAQVIELRAAKPIRGAMSELARQWGVHPATAHDAARGETWKHLGADNGI